MFDNYKKHRILNAVSRFQLQGENPNLTAAHLDSICRHLKFSSKEDFGRLITYLVLDKYLDGQTFKYTSIGMEVETLKITNKGLLAVTSDYFKNKERYRIGVFIKEFLLVICNVGVLIVALYALNKKDSATTSYIKELQSKVSIIELQLGKKTTIRDTLYYLTPVQLNSLTKSKK